MTKCDFCCDNIDVGLPPTCVAACPLRVLDYGTLEELRTFKDGQNLWELPATEHPFPLPNYSRTEPHLVIKPHTGMQCPLEKTVANQEEIQPRQQSENRLGITAIHELPLVVFTLLTQMAVGMTVFGLVVSPLSLPVMLAIGILLGMGGLISFLHLGRKRNAWRAVIHLKKSWLSREILMAGLFGAAWALTAGLEWFKKISPSPWMMAILGLGLIYSMARVYMIRAVPTWNSWRTPAAFYLSTAILGVLGVKLDMPFPGWSIIVGFSLIAEMGMILTARPSVDGAAGRLRIVLLGLGITGILLTAFVPQVTATWLVIPIFIFVLTAEAIGRWQFYAVRLQ
jgi:DMSO reductase anchor subunit